MTKLLQMSAGRMKLHNQKPVTLMTTMMMMAPQLPHQKFPVEHLKASLRWLETQDVDSIKVLQLRNILDFARSQQFAAKKQTLLDRFFKK